MAHHEPEIPFILREHEHTTFRDRGFAGHNRPHLPPLPDLRFELTYLRSIQPFVRLRRRPSPDAKVESVSKDENSPFSEQAGPAEVIEIEWMHVLWVTARDQIISPLIQGTLWALISFYLSPFSARIGHGLIERLPSRSTITKKEGRGAGFLREWAKGLGLSSNIH
ncbi:hypothetical protein EV361DRAFT_796293 [Lentinula raphanica]|uniref:Uncharacterized protein n=1 Tax=Lentinula raphanica TaxID=153919 RepID=A0AA38PJ16_9AGAR|nr:hypothetical protein EV360DRAFT_38152 [Lentinula raphanica]KAJ3820660.1 hypothetical protein F5880DRAFT_1615375 [Lentinula raphanica]KAJ3843860.1 hypothetical protein F5878DRAFT_656389 [Lentinula raphanica]KAJ3973406.1 hypothetical protein EV361DRAFT_796293 [Lentinula raphanica]